MYHKTVSSWVSTYRIEINTNRNTVNNIVFGSPMVSLKMYSDI